MSEGPVGISVNEGAGESEMITMVVLPGNEVKPAGMDTNLQGGEQFVVDEPTAIVLAGLGHAEVVE